MRVIPCAAETAPKDGCFVMDGSLSVRCPFKNIRDNLNGFLLKKAGFSLPEGDGIVFELDEGVPSDEGYRLSVGDGVRVAARTERGLFYGAQTLKQLFSGGWNPETRSAKIGKCVIEDAPRFGYRGFMMDCCRHFFDAETVKAHIDAMSMLKLNRFHWHLTEDQGWRVEIDGYPRLTEVGSRRSGTMRDRTPHGGFYTKDEIRDVVRYAADRYVEVIPEFDFPGHTRAAVASYPELSCSGKPVSVSTKFGIHSEILCAGKQGTYDLINAVLDTFADLFPSRYVHLGGDEAVKTEWFSCPDCARKKEELGLDTFEQLQAHMTNAAIGHLAERGKTAVCWNEAADSGDLDGDAVMEFWREGGGRKNLLRELKNGRKVILAPFTPYYLDYPFSMHPLKAVYRCEPVFPEIKEYEDNVLGVESPVWTEWIDSVSLLGERVYPRLAAVAESAWSAPEKKDYAAFVGALPRVMKDVEEQTGIVSADVRKSNPPFFAKPFITLRFASKMLDLEMIGRSLSAARQMKRNRESGKVKK